MTEATKITMWLADKAILASGILDSGIPRERIGVLVSQNPGEAAMTLTDLIITGYVHEYRLPMSTGPFTSVRISRAPSNAR